MSGNLVSNISQKPASKSALRIAAAKLSTTVVECLDSWTGMIHLPPGTSTCSTWSTQPEPYLDVFSSHATIPWQDMMAQQDVTVQDLITKPSDNKQKRD
jgi:hypothetical protein